MQLIHCNNYELMYADINACMHGACVVPADVVLVEEVTVLLLLLPNTAVTLTVQLLPALREEMVWVVAPPTTVSVADNVCCESHKS